MSPLATIQPLANPAGHTDIRGSLGTILIHFIPVDEMFGLAQIATYGHGQSRPSPLMPTQNGIHSAGNSQKGAAVGHTGLLGE